MIDILKLQRATERYEMADGVRDFQHALWIAIMGVYAWLVWDMTHLWYPSVYALQESQGTFFALLVVFVFAWGIPILLSQGLLALLNEYVRRRWLWRETGVVTPRSMIVPRAILVAAFAICIVIIVAGVWLASQTQDPWTVIRALYGGIGVQLAFMYLMMGERLGLRRYRGVAAAGLLGTLAALLLPLTPGLMALAVSGVWVVVLVGSGVYALRQMDAARRGLPDGA